MSRKTRYLKSVNEYFHLFNRGVNREQIFFKRSDYTSFIDRMTRCLDRSLLAIIAYCLMPNHFHIVVLQKVPYAMADFMKGVCQEHAKRINAWLDRKGHLFEGRYKLKHVFDPSYLASLSRYVHMNPVEARLVRSPTDWEYSSCGDYCGTRGRNIVDPDAVLDLMESPEQYFESLAEFRTQDLEKVRWFFKHRNRKQKRGQ